MKEHLKFEETLKRVRTASLGFELEQNITVLKEMYYDLLYEHRKNKHYGEMMEEKNKELERLYNIINKYVAKGTEPAVKKQIPWIKKIMIYCMNTERISITGKRFENKE